MPDIPALTAEDQYRVILYLPASDYETLCAYAAWKNGTPEYILTASIPCKLAPERDFVKWRSANQRSFVPPNAKPIKRAIAPTGGARRRARRQIASTPPSAAEGNGHALTDGEH